MKNKRELRNMAEKMLGAEDKPDECTQTIAISGENHTIVIYARGPITIQQGAAPRTQESAKTQPAPVRVGTAS